MSHFSSHNDSFEVKHTLLLIIKEYCVFCDILNTYSSSSHLILAKNPSKFDVILMVKLRELSFKSVILIMKVTH